MNVNCYSHTNFMNSGSTGCFVFLVNLRKAQQKLVSSSCTTKKKGSWCVVSTLGIHKRCCRWGCWTLRVVYDLFLIPCVIWPGKHFGLFVHTSNHSTKFMDHGYIAGKKKDSTFFRNKTKEKCRQREKDFPLSMCVFVDMYGGPASKHWRTKCVTETAFCRHYSWIFEGLVCPKLQM